MRKFNESMKKRISKMLATEGLNIALFFHFREFEEEFACEIQRFFRSGAPPTGKNKGMKLVKGNRTLRRSGVYCFELRRFALDRRGECFAWGISKLKPKPSADPAKLIPQALRDQLSEAPVDLNRMSALDFESTHLGKMFHVIYTRVNEESIVGRMWEAGDGAGEEGLPRERVDIRFSDPWKKRFDKSYAELFLYMEGNPELKMDIFNRFYLLQKPRIQQEAEEKDTRLDS